MVFLPWFLFFFLDSNRLCPEFVPVPVSEFGGKACTSIVDVLWKTWLIRFGKPKSAFFESRLWQPVPNIPFFLEQAHFVPPGINGINAQLWILNWRRILGLLRVFHSPGIDGR